MKPTPPGWPRISSSLYYDDPKKAIDWLCSAFGFELRLLVEGDGGKVEHSELVFGDGVIMVAGSKKSERMAHTRTPTEASGNTQNLFMYVDDVEAHCKRAREAGAKITNEPATSDYGDDFWSDRSYGCTDIGGHHWWISERIRNPKPDAKPAKHVKARMTDVDRTLTALADPTRRGVVELLRKKPRRAGEIAEAFEMSPPAMSRHLRVLRTSGLVEETHEGDDARVRVYRLRHEPFNALRKWLEEVETFWTRELASFKEYAERTRGKPKR